ncbi:MAG: two-component system sensor histidine kinase NtrB [bacterium]
MNFGVDWSKKRIVLLTRWLVVIVISYLIIFGQGLNLFSLMSPESLLILIYVISNIILSFQKESFFDHKTFDIALFFFDTTMISLGIYTAGVIEADFYVVFFLEIIILSIAHSLKSVILSAFIFCTIYGFFLIHYLQRNFIYKEDYLLRLPFLFIVALYFGSVIIIVKRNMRAIKNLSETCHLILTSIHDMVFSLDTEGKFTFVSPSCKYVVGETASALMSEPDRFYDLVLAEHKGKTVALMKNLVKTPAQGKFEFKINHPTRGVCWLQMTYSPTRDKKGMLCGVQGSIRDVTDLKETQHAIMRSESTMSMGRLASGMALEINNPLQAVKNVITILEKNSNFVQTHRYALDMLRESEHRIENIMQKIIEMSQFDTSDKGLVDVHQLLQKVVSLTKHQMKLDQIQIKFAFSPDDAMVLANSKLLYQAFLNIIINSIESMEGGGKISLSSLTKDAYIEIQLTDTGRGIPAEHLPSIFNPFYTTKKKTNASGLGLTVSYWIINDMGGDIRINSLDGIGTTVIITIPLYTGSPVPETASHQEVCHA